MDWTNRRQRFREILAGDTCVHPGSVYDPVSARIAEDLGFEIGMFAGSIASMTVLGAPDLLVLTLSEFSDQCLRINRAGNLPLMVDADHGYGNALNVRRTVEELETAGIAGMSLEDTELPTPFGTAGKPQMISLEEGIGKMRAAVGARQDPLLSIAGRTSACAVTDAEDAAIRARAYQEAGVDAVFLAGLTSREELDAVSDKVDIPLILGSTPPEIADLDYLGSKGVRIALQGHLPFSMAMKAVHDTLKALRDGTKPADIQGRPDPEMLKRFTRDDLYRRWIEDFLGGS